MPSDIQISSQTQLDDCIILSIFQCHLAAVAGRHSCLAWRVLHVYKHAVLFFMTMLGPKCLQTVLLAVPLTACQCCTCRALRTNHVNSRLLFWRMPAVE